jgi:hypothetical protein
VNAFFKAGYSQENLVDESLLVGDKTIFIYVHNTIKIQLDFFWQGV